MTAQQLRNSILQHAIQGRLVPQDPNDEPASVLLERIRKEKEQLVKEGKLKKKDLVTTPIADDEKPFDIPSGWEWCRIGEISSSYIGLTYSPSDVSDGGMLVLRSSNIKEGKLNLCDQVRVKKDVPEKLLVNNNDILICARNGSKKLVGKSAIIKGINEPMTFGAFMAICKTPYYKYVYQFLQSDLFFSQLREVSGTTTINQLTQNNFNSFIIPLPPLAEQRRIVAKIEELMPLVEKYGKAQTELDTLNQDLPRRLRQSVLQQAIQGKLVEQDEKDEPASVLLERIRKEKEQLVKEGKLKKKDLIITPIADEEKPFDIPSGWEWCNLGNILSIVTGKKDANQGCENGPYPFFTCSMTPIRSTTYSFEGEAILLPGNGANVGMSILYDGKFEVYQRTYVLQSLCDNCLFLPYIKLALDWNWKQYNDDKLYGSAIPYIKLSNLQNYIFPLPPLAEQRRIVAKIEELFAEIDKLK